jgi:hypothetical protein
VPDVAAFAEDIDPDYAAEVDFYNQTKRTEAWQDFDLELLRFRVCCSSISNGKSIHVSGFSSLNIRAILRINPFTLTLKPVNPIPGTLIS